jgi:hypothetical protein
MVQKVTNIKDVPIRQGSFVHTEIKIKSSMLCSFGMQCQMLQLLIDIHDHNRARGAFNVPRLEVVRGGGLIVELR